jgi:eukaryotic-like serine/threonine-protein kinase
VIENNSSWVTVSELFDRLEDADDDKVESAIREAGIDSSAAELLRKMLVAHKREHILDQSVDKIAGELLDGLSFEQHKIPDDLTGAFFGPWRIVEEIERGGMGAVLRAERADGQFEKTVALKVIKPGRYSSFTRGRFQEEMRMLARLEHPGIVRLIDGGINDEGIPWFAMEYVEGSPITVHADRNRLSLAERIALLIETCKAVEHAHRNLIVHGDIKPSNILVTRRGRVRLVDFGIARSLQDEGEDVVLPQLTPRYASPELASGEPITTASDVFGLCAVLYELVCGMAPRGEVSTTTHGDYRQFMQTPIPHALERYDGSASNKEIAQHRGASSRFLRRALQGDLHWILELGLKGETMDRLSSVAELRKELARYLEGRPVDAHPPGNAYRLRKFVTRYKLPVVAVTTAFVALSVSAAVTTMQADLATQEAAKARWSRDFLIRLFDKADPWRNQQSPITANEIAAAAVADLLDNRESLLAETRGMAASILARVEGRLGNLQSSENLLNLQIELLERDVGSDSDLAAALIELGVVMTNQDRYEAAIDAFRRAHALKPIGPSPDYVSVNAAVELAYALIWAEEAEEPDALLEQLFNQESLIEALERSEVLLAKMYNTRSSLLRLTGDYSGSKEAAELAVEYAKTADSDVAVIVGKSLLGLSESHHQRGDSEAALELDRQVVDIFTTYYGFDHIQTIESRGRLAVTLSNLGRMEEAIAEYQNVLQGQIASLGRENQYVAATMGNIGAAYLALGDAGQALDYYARAQPVWESLEPALPINVAINKIGLARSLHGLLRLQESDEAFSSSLGILAAALGTEHPVYQRVEVYRAPLLLDTNRLDEAGEILPVAYETIRAAYGAESKHTALAGLRWAQLLARTGNSERVLELARETARVFDTDANRRRYGPELGQARELIASSNWPPVKSAE